MGMYDIIYGHKNVLLIGSN